METPIEMGDSGYPHGLETSIYVKTQLKPIQTAPQLLRLILLQAATTILPWPSSGK
jgi:hypothetical protein